MESTVYSILTGRGDITYTTSHNFGTPRVLNPAAAAYYDYLLGGTQIDRGSANADSFVSLVPQSDDWAFTNTAIWYHG